MGEVPKDGISATLKQAPGADGLPRTEWFTGTVIAGDGPLEFVEFRGFSPGNLTDSTGAGVNIHQATRIPTIVGKKVFTDLSVMSFGVAVFPDFLKAG